MREYSKISNSIWTSEKFSRLNSANKLFYLYLLTCQHGNSAGCFKIKIGYMCADMDWPEAQVLDGLCKLNDAGLALYNRVEHTLYIWNWYTFNSPQNPKHAAKIISDIFLIPYCELRNKIISDLIKDLKTKKWKINEKSQIILDRVSSKVATETDTETETVDKIDTGAGNLFSDFWHQFPKQRKGNQAKARQAYFSAIKRDTEENIHAGLQRYIQCAEVKTGFAKGAAAWLNDDRWTTDYETPKGNGHDQKTQRPPTIWERKQKTNAAIDARISELEEQERREDERAGETPALPDLTVR